MKRPSGREADQMRQVTLTRHYTKHAEGSVLVEFGDTKVICTVSVEAGVPRFLRGSGQGWITAEYGTRTASITGACVALVDALRVMKQRGSLKKVPAVQMIAAVSVGIYQGEPVLDLDYLEDSAADTDLNVVVTDKGGFIEVQGTAEAAPFSAEELNAMLALARQGVDQLFALQLAALETE